MLPYVGIGLAAAEVNLLPDLPTILWTIINFVILFFGLIYLLYRPLLKKVDDHERAVDALRRQAGADRDAATRARSDAEAQWADAHRQADGITSAAVQQATALLTRAELDARRQADALRAEAEAMIERDRQRAGDALRAETAELSVRVAGRVLEGYLSNNRQRGQLGVALTEAAKLQVDADVPAVVSVEVRTAAPLADDEAQQLAEALSGQLKREIRLRSTVDPDLIGGVVIRIGDHVIDGSIKTQLQRLYYQLAGDMEMGQ